MSKEIKASKKKKQIVKKMNLFFLSFETNLRKLLKSSSVGKIITDVRKSSFAWSYI